MADDALLRLAARLAGGDPQEEVELSTATWPRAPEFLEVPGDLIGCVVRRRAGELYGAECYLEVPTGEGAVLDRITRLFEAAGWDSVEPPGLMHRSGPFVATGQDGSRWRNFVRGQSGPYYGVTVGRIHDRRADVMVRWDPGTRYHPGWADSSPPRIGGSDLIPPLSVPEGVELRPGGAGGSEMDWHSDAIVVPPQDADALEAHFAKQLTAGGWRRQDRAVAGRVAWSEWTVPRPDWIGVLVVWPIGEKQQRVAIQVASARHLDSVARSFRVP
jgi:hypothetical protein